MQCLTQGSSLVTFTQMHVDHVQELVALVGLSAQPAHPLQLGDSTLSPQLLQGPPHPSFPSGCPQLPVSGQTHEREQQQLHLRVGLEGPLWPLSKLTSSNQQPLFGRMAASTQLEGCPMGGQEPTGAHCG